MRLLVTLISILFPLANAQAAFALSAQLAPRTAWERAVKAFCGNLEVRLEAPRNYDQAIRLEAQSRLCAELLAQNELSPPLLQEIQLFMERVERPQQWRGDDGLPPNRIPPSSPRPDRYTPNPLNPEAPPRFPQVPPSGGGPRCPDSISPQVMRPLGCWPIN